MTDHYKDKVTVLRLPLPVSSDKMDPIDQIAAMVVGVRDVEASDDAVLGANAPPPGLFERVMGIADKGAEHDCSERPDDSEGRSAPTRNEVRYVNPAELAKLRSGLRNFMSSPEAFEHALNELVEEYPVVAVDELVAAYDVYLQPLPHHLERRDAICQAVVRLGSDAVEGILRALTLEERQGRRVSAIELSPLVPAPPVVSALERLVTQGPFPLQELARQALEQIAKSRRESPHSA